jgi:hypothetical protein
MRVSLPNGKSVELPIDVLFLSDKEYDLYIQALMSVDAGEYTEDAFYSSSMDDVKNQIDDGFADDDVLLSRDDI